ncbi:glycosyltransferase family 2 protein [Aureimonas populi]|uniref:Glycosyltransferase family 2 protein n=1 Tax=Aureimonas populi TaxID=1701758 RepID=A0ABW5CPL0_9HYPH|nr:glycosyltransferase family 2 protein [Aureimonas populi]
MQPDVSFIVAAFNASRTIGAAIESALATVGVSVEVVVADDASRDGTAALVEAIADPRVRLVRAAANGGPGAARNLSLEHASGRYVAVLDADDTIRPDRMARLVERLDATGATAILDGIEVVEADGRTRPMLPEGTLPATGTIDLPRYMTSNAVFRSSFNLGYLKPTIRRSFLAEKAISYPEDLRIGEDYIFMAEILARGGTCIAEPKIGYAYGITEGSVSRVLRLDHLHAMRAADVRFRAAHDLDPAATLAMDERESAFKDAESFLTMVEALKGRDLGAFARSAARRPAAMRLFRMPVAKRLSAIFPSAVRGLSP